jgi:aspartyl-tRNA(Asn)/glutamyl-tRNA(Gln) amidotransferase subunit B
MEQGSMRCDVNVSIAPPGAEWGKRTETKNVNSLRSIERAVRSEIERQAGVLDAGGSVTQETRHFQENTGTTAAGRSKEEAQDYRYFPEPDLVPLAPSSEWVEELRGTLSEPPADRRKRLQSDWGVTDFEMTSMRNAGAVDLVEATIAAGAPQADARKWWMGELARRGNELGTPLDELGVTPADVVRVVELVAEGSLNDKLARQVLDGVLAGEGKPDTVVEARGLKIVSDSGELDTVIDQVIADNAAVAEKIRGGKVAAVGALVGGVMKATRGQADAGRAKELILEKLGVSG